jgi:acetyltransferase-like isoleucine patch superfamily enzyme
MFRTAYYRFNNLKIISSNRVEIRGLRGIRTAECLSIGMSSVGFMNNHDRTYINVKNGTLDILGRFSIGKGCRIFIGNNAIATFTSGFINPNCQFTILHSLSVGKKCAISWGCQFMDDDLHRIDYDGKVERKAGIKVGDHVLIGANVIVLKGAVIPDGCIVAAGSLVTAAFSEPNTMIAGVPARVIKHNVTWGPSDFQK